VQHTDLPAARPAPRELRLLLDHLLPLALYLVGFVVLTWPALRSFPTMLFGGAEDLYQNLWNLWWVDKSLTELRQSPYHTTWLHHPQGTTLYGHTLNPFNGLLAIPLRRVTSPVAAHNALLALTFVLTGWTTYHLARVVSGSRGGALLAGFLFTFSAYHVGHAFCHLPLATLQWVPLCLLCLLRLFERPTVTRALLAAGATLLVAMSEHYYLLYCTVAGLVLYAVRARAERSIAFGFRRPFVVPLLVFLLATTATSGMLIIMLLIANQRDPFFGGHSSVTYSADLLAPFIPGGSWRFNAWTESFWERFHAGWVEASVYLGWGTLLLAAIGWRHRPRPTPVALRWLAAVALVFFVLSLGPVLRVWNVRTGIPLPYALLEYAVPAFKVTGMPVRMLVMTSLAAAVLAACGWAQLSAAAARSRGRVTLMALLVGLILFETWPRPLPLTPPEVPPWVHALKAFPGSGGVIDVTTHQAHGMYYQTIHEKPFAFGYVSREPASVRVERLRKTLAARRADVDALRDEWRFDYLVTDADVQVEAPVVYDDGETRIYSLRSE
jgi:hypothetical protein